MIEPIHPFEGGERDGFERPPRATPMDDLGLEQSDHGLGESVIVRVADAADGGFDAVAASLAAFAVVYLVVFGAGIWYLLHLFNQTPHVHESGPPTGVPIRTAGITPAPALDAPRHGASRPAFQPAE